MPKTAKMSEVCQIQNCKNPADKTITFGNGQKLHVCKECCEILTGGEDNRDVVLADEKVSGS